MTLKAQDVFTPGAFPSRTYVERSGEKLEKTLRDAIDTPGQIVSLIGPSKSGKTVLVEKVVGRDLLITVTGAGMRSPEDIWERVLDWMGAPASHEAGTASAGKVEVGVGAKASGGVPMVAKVEGEAKGSIGGSHERTASATYRRGGLKQVEKEMANSDFVVLVDDFHYMPREIQSEAAKSLKEAVRLGIKVCTAAVLHRGDDLVRANPELRGRVRAVDLQYWSRDDLTRIAVAGFDALRTVIDTASIQVLVQESAGSPQLMQLLCLQACFVLNVRKASLLKNEIVIAKEQMQEILEQSSTATDFRSLIDVLDAGPKTRGTERKTYRFRDGAQGDVYRVVLRAVSADPPRLSFSYEELLARTAKICDGESPTGSSVVGTCLHMSRLALDKFPDERAIDWDEQKQILDIPDPYLLFYLRWSGRLREAE